MTDSARVVEASAQQRSHFELGGLDCPNCAAKLEIGVRALPGVGEVSLNFPARTLDVEYDKESLTPGDIRRRVSLFGCSIVGVAAEEEGALRQIARGLLTDSRGLATTIGAAFLFAGFAAFLLGAPPAVVTGLCVLAVAISGARAFRAGLGSVLIAHRADMNTLMASAALGALIIGQPLEGATAMVLFGLGRFLESYSTARTRRTISALLDLTPPVASRLRPDGGTEEIAVGELSIGDRIVVAPSSRIPLDGKLSEGQALLDESPITGESLPVSKKPGDQVFGGTLNGEGRLVVEVTTGVEDNVVSRMIQRMEEAAGSRSVSERWIDSFAAVYTPLVMLLAAGVAVIPPLFSAGILLDPEWIRRGLVVLVTACPCALVISTPVAIAAAIGAGSRHGVLFKTGAAVGTLGQIKCIAFDKTGTLTAGDLRVTKVEPTDPDGTRSALEVASALESQSSHPIASAIMAAAIGADVIPAEVTEFVSHGGRGVEGTVRGCVYALGSPTFAEERWGSAAATDLPAGSTEAVLVLASASGVACRFYLADKVRPDACAVLTALGSQVSGPLVMISGDRREIAEEVAAEVGISEVRAPLLPEDKLNAVSELREQFGTIAMVGDGLNDIPALAMADVGIVMGTAGSDAALEAGDVALMSDDLGRIPYAIKLGKQARKIIKQNVLFSLAAKLAFLPLAILGLAPLWLAVAADMGTSILVTSNSLRLFGVRPDVRPDCGHPEHAVGHID